MTVAEKLIRAKSDIDEVYEAGYSKGKDDGFDWAAFWDRPHFLYAFYRWANECYNPPADYEINSRLDSAYTASTITSTKIKLIATGDCNSTFQACARLVEIPYLDMTGVTGVTNMFYGCSALTKIGFVGLISINNLNLGDCPLDKESLLKLLNCLEEKTDGSVWTVTIGSINKAKLTETELEVAYSKGWTVK